MYSGHPKNTADIIALGFNPGFFEYQEKNAVDTDPILVSLRLSNVRGKDGETIPIFLLLITALAAFGRSTVFTRQAAFLIM